MIWLGWQLCFVGHLAGLGWIGDLVGLEIWLGWRFSCVGDFVGLDIWMVWRFGWVGLGWFGDLDAFDWAGLQI